MNTNEAPPVMQVQELTEAQIEGMVLTTMRRRGTLFEGYLAAAWLAAAPEDAAKLRAAFPDLYDHYRRMALGVVS